MLRDVTVCLQHTVINGLVWLATHEQLVVQAVAAAVGGWSGGGMPGSDVQWQRAALHKAWASVAGSSSSSRRPSRLLVGRSLGLAVISSHSALRKAATLPRNCCKTLACERLS